jgi:hypothetical protein
MAADLGFPVSPLAQLCTNAFDSGHAVEAFRAVDQGKPGLMHGSLAEPVSQGRWLVSLTQWTAANSRPCHWILLMQAEPRYSR